ncbi:MAG: PAS domain S-box protein [Candidatus Methylophosphatis roskildensis]
MAFFSASKVSPLAPSFPRWLWHLPRVAPLLALVATLALLWSLHRSDIEEQRATLISDVLWVEQNIRFQMERNAEQLGQLGREAASGTLAAATYEARAQALIRNSQGLVRIVRLDPQARPLAHSPPLSGADLGAMIGGIAGTLGIARRLARPVYGPAQDDGAADSTFAVAVPVFADTNDSGSMVGVYSLRTLLAESVPWWFTQKYRLNIVDGNGSVLASKSSVDALSTTLSYQVPFDPPGNGLAIEVIAYRLETRVLPALLVLAIVALLGAVVFSLSSLRRHVQGRYAAEAALRDEHGFRKAMEDSLLTGLRARDLDGRIIYVNPAFCRMVGWSAVELIGMKPPMPYWSPEEYEQTRAIHDLVLAGRAPPEGVEVRLKRKNGELFEALIIEAPLIDAQGKQRGWMGSVLDITERKRALEFERQQQDKLQATARLVTMGELASTLAHELNQPLSAIASYNTGCINRLEEGQIDREQILAVLKKLGQQAQRAGQIVRRVHEFVRRSEPNRVPASVDAIVEDSVELLDPAARKRGARIDVSYGKDLPEVLADRVMVEQVILNLARNGLDAMTDLPLDERVLSLSTARNDDDTLRVSIADRGCGISGDTERKLFSPFFTTKAEGMGMGLNICRSIVELHKGRLWFEPNPTGGTIFHFTLPLAHAEIA